MRGEGRGKMGAGVGGAPPPGSPQVTATQQHEGSPGTDPLTAWGGPHCRHPRWDGRAGPGLPLPFLQVEKAVCGLSPRVPCSASCPRLLPEVDSGNPSWEPRLRVYSGALPALRALNSRFALSPGSTEAAPCIAAATYSTNQWLNVTDASWGHGQSSWTGSHGAQLCPQMLQENPFPGL